ncbi:MAG: sasA [Acidobacteria bacterium]|nr:sasA [Acidobacteriota bacterium]
MEESEISGKGLLGFTVAVPTAFSKAVAERVIAANRELALRWLSRLEPLVPVHSGEIFPSPEPLNHIPELIARVGVYLRSADQEEIAANAAVVSKAQELGWLRHSQRASIHQILKEYELLGAILATFMRDETARLAVAPDPSDCFDVMVRLQKAVAALQQATVDTFLSLYVDTITAQGRRIDDFTRVVSHELRQPISALQMAVHLLKVDPGARSPERLDRSIAVLHRNVDHVLSTMRNLELVSRSDPDNPVTQEVSLTAIANEAARRLRDVADARYVDIRVAQNLPVVNADVARVELVLMNLLSNAIKYSDPAKPDRIVTVERVDSIGGTCAVAIADNGLGIAADQVTLIFERYVRAHADRDLDLGVEGRGLGLDIVRKSVHSLGGAIDVRSTEGVGTTFTLTLPLDDAPGTTGRQGRPSPRAADFSAIGHSVEPDE